MARERSEHYKNGFFAAGTEDGIALGHVVQDDGETVVVSGVTTSEEASWAMRRGLEETFGAEPGSSEVTNLPLGSGSTSTFGFGNWAGSTWEPTGPKPNWRVNPPKDPHAN